MTNRQAELISAILHPVFLPVFFALLLISNSLYDITAAASLLVLLIYLLFTTILPLISVLILLRTGWLKDLTMQSRYNRSYPMIVTLLFNVLFLYLSARFQANPILNYITLFTAFTIILSWGLNIFTKLSLHLAGWAAFAASTIWFMKMGWLQTPVYIVISILLLGIVATARLKLKAHNGIELIVGTITGILAVILTNYLIFRMA